jgi:hypothetical protein
MFERVHFDLDAIAGLAAHAIVHEIPLQRSEGVMKMR